VRTFRFWLLRLAVALSQLFPAAAVAAAASDQPTQQHALTDRIVNDAEKWPMTVGFFLMLGAIGYLIRWLITTFWPQWQDAQQKRAENAQVEAEKTRAHITQLMRERDEAAGKREKEIVDGLGVQVREVVVVTKELSGRIHETNTRVSGIYEIVKVVAGKVGVGGLIVLLSAGSALACAASALGVRVPLRPAAVRSDLKFPDCSGVKNPDGTTGCKSPQKCCDTNRCCLRANTPEAEPRSSLASACVPYAAAQTDILL
jgi:hypothetical protein